MNLPDLFRRIILANELGNNVALIYKFSDPDGIRTGKSGWSFGLCQYDIANNPSATLALRECGFTTDQIAGLKSQTIADMAPMHAILRAARMIVDAWDARQLQDCLTHASHLLTASGISFDSSGLLACADYHNQFHMSANGKLHTYLQTLNQSVTAAIVRDFKLTLPWGKKRPDDVERRYTSIVTILRHAK